MCIIKYLTFKLIKEYLNNEPGTVKILNQFDIHFLVMTNPDGYKYSHETPVTINDNLKWFNLKFLIEHRTIDFGGRIWL